MSYLAILMAVTTAATLTPQPSSPIPPISAPARPESPDPALQVAPMDPKRSLPTEPGPNAHPVPGVIVMLLHRLPAGGPIIELHVPEQYVQSREGVVNSLFLWFLATYPDMKGSFDLRNQNLSSCIGYCRGRMSIGVQNRSGFPYNASPRLNMARNFGNVSPSPLGDLKGVFDEAYETGIHIDATRGPNVTLKSILYIRRNKEGRVEATVQCFAYAPNPMCQETMLLPGHPDLMVQYSFGFRDLRAWPTLRTSVGHLVDGFYFRSWPSEKTKSQGSDRSPG